MMIFMMRGMHSGHGTSKPGHDVRAGHDGSATPDLQTPDERIDALEHERAELRDLRDRQSDHDRARGS
jgi:hypothetical protein